MADLSVDCPARSYAEAEGFTTVVDRSDDLEVARPGASPAPSLTAGLGEAVVVRAAS